MEVHAVLTAMGRDRVGVADDLAAALAARKIEIEDSRMSALKGQFAVLVHVTADGEAMERLRGELGTLGGGLGFQLNLQVIEARSQAPGVTQFLIESFSRGPSGIPAVTGVLKRHEINIEDLETAASATPWTSKMTFHMKARITLPPSLQLARLKQEFGELERERNIDIVIQPIPSPVRA